MDAIQLIRRDHRTIEQLFKAFERGAEDVETRGRVAREIIRELSVHAGIEQQLVYPALRDAGRERDVLEALEEHHAAKVTLAELDAMPASGERFVAKMKVVFTSVRAHIEDEERELLPALEKALDASARQELGEALEKARRVAPTRPHPAAPDTPPGNLIANSVAAILDRARDAARGGLEMLRTLAERSAESGVHAARRLLYRGQQRAWQVGAELRETGREGLDEMRELPGEILAELDERREQGRRALQGSARDVARALDGKPSRRKRRSPSRAAQANPRKRTNARASSGNRSAVTH